MVSAAKDTLANLAAQLGVSTTKTSSSTDNNKHGNLLVLWEDEDDCDFSSFPSLSLEESPGNYHTGTFNNRGDVESHIQSLLSRPILLGKQEQTSEEDPDDPELDDSLDEFFVSSLETVPKLMLTNFCTSFSTLMNSRLRAYATFLTQHALSLATENEVEGMVGIEHKLETMLGIGSQLTAGALVSDFIVDMDNLEQKQEAQADMDKEEDEDTTTFELSLPLEVDIHINIALPHVNEGDGNEFMKVSFKATGNMCGIFSKSYDISEGPLLRVAEVKLNMHELLTDMTTQAARVISRIIDMTNAAYIVPLPFAPHEHAENRLEDPKTIRAATPQPLLPPARKRRSSFIEDDLDDDYDDEDSIESLSPDRCATIVDCVIADLDDTVLSPPTAKKLKAVHAPSLASLQAR